MFNYDGVEGGKTGYTTKAGGTLVTFAKRGDQELIVDDTELRDRWGSSHRHTK